MAIVNDNSKLPDIFNDDPDRERLEASTRWQIRQSWASAMANLPNLMAEHDVTFWPTDAADEAMVESRRITERALPNPGQLKRLIPLSQDSVDTVRSGRDEAADIIRFQDDRLLVLVGPCSIHDPDMALEYARRLKKVADQLQDDLCLVMRAYLEKPRTTTGWKGLISDPNLDDSSDMVQGLRTSRQVCSNLTQTGLPLAGELLDPVAISYYADFMSVGSIGARTTESQVHRMLASGMPFPVGFKNATNGSVDVAIHGLMAAAASHKYPSLTDSGATKIIETSGNLDSFVILRGGTQGPNFSSDHVTAAHQTMLKAGRGDVGIVIDCSHGNSEKDYRRQAIVADAVGAQLSSGQNAIVGVMIESNIEAGKQSLSERTKGGLKKGISITDGCIGWESTVEVLEKLATAVRVRREVNHDATRL